ncbi:hypothetical protein D3C71_1987280 [compost metagenome]
MTNEFRGFLAVGDMPAVGHVQQRLIGQQALDLSQYRQTTHAGIEDADRRCNLLSHCARHTRCIPGRA